MKKWLDAYLYASLVLLVLILVGIGLRLSGMANAEIVPDLFIFIAILVVALLLFFYLIFKKR